VTDPEWTEADFPTYGGWEDPGPRLGAVVLAVDRAGRVLMQLRDLLEGVPLGGAFAPFGGGVEDGETLLQAALREFEEETGILLNPSDLKPLGRVLSSHPGRTRLYCFAARFPGGPEALRLGEGAGFAFLTPDQVLAFPVAESARALALAAPGALES
jgi:8-oxo-dGTP pyrophosphatase MutT (NUDIX family)